MNSVRIGVVLASFLLAIVLFSFSRHHSVSKAKAFSSTKSLLYFADPPIFVKEGVWHISVKRVVHPDYPSLSEIEYKKALREAEKILEQKLEVPVRFVDVGTTDIATFFKPLREGEEEGKYACYAHLWKYSQEEYRDFLKEFIHVFQLSDDYLRLYFPHSQRSSLKNTDQIVERIVREYNQSLNVLKKTKIRGIPLVQPGGCYCNSSSCWMERRLYKRDAYFVVTNVPILLDEPTAFIPLLRGGVFDGAVWFVSTFSTYGDRFLRMPVLINARGPLPNGKRTQIAGLKIAEKAGRKIAFVSGWDYLAPSHSTCLFYNGPVYFKDLVKRFRAVVQSAPCQLEINAAKQTFELYSLLSLVEKGEYKQAKRKLSAAGKGGQRKGSFLLLKLVIALKLKDRETAKQVLAVFAKDKSYTAYRKMEQKFETGLDYLGFYTDIRHLLTNQEKTWINGKLSKLRTKNEG